MSNSAFTPSVLTVSTNGGGTGQGEISVVTNGNAVTDTTGWTGATRVTSNSPLNPLTPTAFSIGNGQVAEGATTGGYASFTLPSGLQNRKLKVEFYYTTPAADNYAVSVYKGGVRVPLSTDASNATNLPKATTGKFTAYFDTDTTASWTLNVTRTSGTAGPCYITNVVVGPGIQPQGAVVGEWVSFTPVPTENNTDRSAGFQLLLGDYRRVGDSVEFKVRLRRTASSIGAGTNALGLRCPVGTINLAALPLTSAGFYQPAVVIKTSATEGDGTSSISTSLAGNNTILFEKQLSTTSLLYNDTDLPASAHVEITGTIPIAEWAGSGTVQLAQNDVEYASNSSGLTTAGGSNPAAFAYGPSGATIGSIASTTGASSTTTMRVRFQTPIQAGDSIVVETDLGQNEWVPAAQRFPWTPQLLSFYGINTIAVSGSTTDIDVLFGNQGASPYGNASYGASGQTWATFGTWKWRVRKSSAGAAVGFGIVSPGVSSGLVSAAGLPGNTTGNAIAAGYVGETKISTATRGFTSNTATAIGWSINNTPTGDRTLTPGIWLVTYSITISVTSGTTADDRACVLTTDTADGWGPTSNLSNLGNINFIRTATSGSDTKYGIATVVVTSSGIVGGTGFNLYTKMYATTHTSFTGSYDSRIAAVRIA